MTSTRLLLLEDDESLRASLRLVLEGDGYEVVEASTAEHALQEVDGVDLMLVDLMLGGMDGFSFIQRARPQTEAPIVVISARDGVEDIVAALEAGADDYVTKPFVVPEVQARLRALLRRPALARSDDEGQEADVVTLDSQNGPLILDVGAAIVRRGPTEVHLTVTEYKLLVVLSENAGKVLSRSSLLQTVWDSGFFGDERIVDVHVRRLRKKIEVDPGSPSLLVTVRGLGYRLDVR